jgi:hypothetical protein
MAKRFMFVSIGVLCLMVSALIGFHLGGQSAQAQAYEPIAAYRTVATGPSQNDVQHFVIWANGDVFRNRTYHGAGPVIFNDPANYVGNFYTGNSGVPVAPETWGNIKGKYDGDR